MISCEISIILISIQTQKHKSAATLLAFSFGSELFLNSRFLWVLLTFLSSPFPETVLHSSWFFIITAFLAVSSVVCTSQTKNRSFYSSDYYSGSQTTQSYKSHSFSLSSCTDCTLIHRSNEYNVHFIVFLFSLKHHIKFCRVEKKHITRSGKAFISALSYSVTGNNPKTLLEVHSVKVLGSGSLPCSS